MLTTYVKTPLALEQYRSGPAGPHLDAFIDWLEERGYQRRRIPHLIRGVKRFSFWAQDGLHTTFVQKLSLTYYTHNSPLA